LSDVKFFSNNNSFSLAALEIVVW